jgi:ceramide glucosyltransferase
MRYLSILLLGASAVGLLLYLVQLAALAWHRRRGAPAAAIRPPISILRPLCGHDDDLAALLDEVATLPYPDYEVLLGVRDACDPAYLVAVAAARRHERLRVVVQRGAPGINPKVNQLVTLARAARHDLLVVSDANVRLPAGYLDEIAAHLARPDVGLVTHPIVGAGAQRLGALLDNLHMTASIGPGMVGAQRVSGKDFVVGKSMAMWRADLDEMGGFEVVCDVLAEDYVLGRRVRPILRKRVVMASGAVVNLVRDRDVPGFLDRYGRWAVLHRQAVDLPTFLLQLLLNPSLLAVLGLLCAPSATAALVALDVLLVRAIVDGASGALLGRSFTPGELAATPLRDACLGLAWTRGLVTDTVVWRGNRLRVGPGTVLRRDPALALLEESAASGVTASS